MIDISEKYIDIEKILLCGQTIQIKPEGYSMYPFIVPGRDEVIIEPVGSYIPKRSDIVLYRRKQGLLVLHRIYKCTDKGFYMVGDNQTEVEGPIEYEQIKGIMTAVIRKQKKISAGNFFYAFAGSLWLVLRPVRMYIAKPVAAVKKIFRKVMKS